jgi:hypothetical protein
MAILHLFKFHPQPSCHKHYIHYIDRESLNKPRCDLFVTGGLVINITSIAVVQVVDIVLRLLEDDWLEVREKASQVLGGLLHCNFIETPDDLIVSSCVVHAAASAVATLHLY